MPWQQHVADVALEVDDAGKFVYRQVVLTVPRQCGKTSLLLALLTWRCLGMGSAQHVTYAAQSGVAARQKFIDEYAKTLERSALRDAAKVRRTSGHESVWWRNGSRATITAATEKAGHGGSLDLPVIDEAFAYTDARLEQAFRPAMRARPNPQMWVVSTAGTADSTYLRSKVDGGRAAVAAGLTTDSAYFEWSADDDADPADPATWWSCIPALGITVDEDTIRSEYETAEREGSVGEFRRASLNQWTLNKIDPVIPADVWVSLADPDAPPPMRPAFALDVTADRSAASVCAAGEREDGRVQVAVIEHRPGTGWVAERCKQLTDTHGGELIVDPGGPSGGLIPLLESAGVPLRLMRTRDVMQACGGFYDACMNDRLRHLGQDELNEAIGGARRRPVGDAWAWGRRDVAVDVSPLIAATNALWGANQAAPDYDPLASAY
jgi:hypothetical protein